MPTTTAVSLFSFSFHTFLYRNQLQNSTISMLFFWSQLVILRSFEPIQSSSAKPKKRRSARQKHTDRAKHIDSMTLETAAVSSAPLFDDVTARRRSIAQQHEIQYTRYFHALEDMSNKAIHRPKRERRPSKSAFALTETNPLSLGWKHPTSSAPTCSEQLRSPRRKPLEISMRVYNTNTY